MIPIQVICPMFFSSLIDRVFFSLLALLFVYGALEFKTVKKEFALPTANFIEPDILVEFAPVYTLEQKKEIIKQEVKNQKFIEKFKKAEDLTPTKPTFLDPEPKIEETDIDKQIGQLPNDNTPEDPDEKIDKTIFVFIIY